MVVVVLLLALTACAGEDTFRDEDGVVVNPGADSVFNLRPGDCLDAAPDLTGELAEVALVPCEDPHTQEVFGLVRHPDDAYPGASEVAAFADGACLAELDASLGFTLDDGVFFSYLLPTFDGWNTNDDREIVCVLVFPDREAVTGSFVAGTAQLEPAEPAEPSVPTPEDEDDDGEESDLAGADDGNAAAGDAATGGVS